MRRGTAAVAFVVATFAPLVVASPEARAQQEIEIGGVRLRRPPPPVSSGCDGDGDCKLGRVCSARRCTWGDTASTSSGCHGDSECKGDRVCDTGRCVSRAPASHPPAPPVAVQAPATSAAPSPGFVSASPQPTAYALIIGIEKYRNIPSPSGARGDAEKFAKLARQTLGIPESHIVLALDDRASKGDIEKHLEWLRTNATPGSRIYFFFSGHGAPEPSTGTSYVLPYDGDPRYLDGTALRLQTILAKLQETKAREVLAILDSCFSGSGGRSVLPPGARALVRVQTPVAAARIALFSASSGAETSGPTPGGSEGLFTKFLLDGIGNAQADINGDGQVSLDELRDWVKPRVSREAKRDHRDQNPDLVIGSTLGAPSSFVVAWGLPAK